MKDKNFSEKELNKFYRYSLSLTKNEDDAFDLLHNSIEKFILKDGFSKDYPDSYLYTIIRNKFIDGKRHDARWNVTSIDIKDSKIALIDMDALDVDSYVSNDQMERILSSVSPEERELLYLWAVEGHNVRSISEKFKVPRSTILSRLQQIKIRLRRIFSKEYPKLAATKSS